jgi:Ca-activated chloride channel homolog
VSTVSFGEPTFLVLAVLLLPVAWWGLRREGRRHRHLLSVFGDESLLALSSALPAPRARLAALGLSVSAIVCGLVALARPQLGERPTTLAGSGHDVLVLLDLSRSMNAVDDRVSRLVAAKHTIPQVLTAVPESRVGLIIFGGGAFLQLPLTGNQAAFQRFLEAASTDDLGDPATNLSAALSAAATTFEHEGEPGYRSVLVVSDGESGEGDANAALSRLRGAGIPVFAVGVGSPEGAPVPADSSEAPEKWHRDHIGRVVISRLQEGDLRRAARETGGAYTRWTPGAGQSVGVELARMPKRTISSRESTERVDRFQWPLTLAVLAVALAPVAGMRRRRPQT